MNYLTGFHAIEEALAAGRPLDRILIARGRRGERMEAIVRLAKSRGKAWRTPRNRLQHQICCSAENYWPVTSRAPVEFLESRDAGPNSGGKLGG